MGSVVRGTRLCVVCSLLLPPTYTVHSTQYTVHSTRYTVESIDTMVWYVVALLYIVSPVFTGDLNRQSVIFNENTPDVFYCPQDKPISIDRMLVKSKPMKKLCEHEGRPLPEGAKSDCWNDVDETEYACSEKKRIMLRLEPPGHENAIIDNYVPIFRPGHYKIRRIEDLDLSKIL